jgi:hypothetical protein
MKHLRPPINDVRELFDFLAAWHDVPVDVSPVTVPFETPSPLSELYGRFGLLAGSESWVRPDLCWSDGLFSCQNFIVAATQLGKEEFVAPTGLFADKRHWLVLRENQHCWFAYVPIGCGDDPPVVYTEVDDTGQPKGAGLASGPLSAFLATHVLIETVFTAPRLWFIGDHLFCGEDSILPLVPLLIGARLGYPELQYDFYVDPSERVLIMNMPESGSTWVASREVEVEEIVVDRIDCVDCCLYFF